jgi:uncharacterized membrane protein YfcA
MEAFVTLGLALLVAGLLAGFSGGLLGIGGGIVIVPVFVEILRMAGYGTDASVHVAVGTSLASIVFTSLRSVSAHAQKGAVDWPLFWRYAPAVFWGAAAGSLIAAFISGTGLRMFFGCVCCAFALYVAFAPIKWTLTSQVPRHWLSHVVSAVIGGASALMGIGGGTFGVTAMTLCGVPIHRAVATGAGLGVCIGLPATIGFILAGWDMPGRPPWSLGHVNLAALAIIAPASVIAAPWGARAAHALPVRPLRIVFGCFLAASGLRMLLA